MTTAVQSRFVASYTPSQVAKVLQTPIILPSSRVSGIFDFCRNCVTISQELESIAPVKHTHPSRIDSSIFQFNFICLQKLISEIQSIATKILCFSKNLSGKPVSISGFNIQNSTDCKFFVSVLNRAASTLQCHFKSEIEGTEWGLIADNIPHKAIVKYPL